jgi:peptide/nickel transport system substrate-binding protein
MTPRIINISRRRLMQSLIGGSALASLGPAGTALGEKRGSVLVIGMDISDVLTYDTAVGTAYTAPLVYKAAYDTLVTMAPGAYTTIKPALATAWERTPDGAGWRFTLRENVKFNSGAPLTVNDVVWSLERVINMKGQASLYVANIAAIRAADSLHLDIILKDPSQPLLDIICAPSFSVLERKVAEAHGGLATTDADSADKAGPWLNQHSCGTGAYTLAGWDRNTSVSFGRNPYSWQGEPHFERVILRHMADSSTQLLALQRGDIDVAFNLVPEQVAAVGTSSALKVEQLESLDMIYLALSCSPEFNKALAVREARQAIASAIDYDGIRDNLLGGAARRPATVLPIGSLGSLDATSGVGYRRDLEKARSLLAQAGLPKGFSFRLSYGNGLIAGVPYATLAQKLQADLARVNIVAELDPLDFVTMRTQYTTGKTTSTIQYWNPSAVSNWLWASATVERLASRLHWSPPETLVSLIKDAARETDASRQIELWADFQRQMAADAFLLVLFQPTYQIGVRRSLTKFPLTAAGWLAELGAAA